MAKSTVRLSSQDGAISGLLTLDQASESTRTTFTGQIQGLKPGKHAIAIHVLGDLSKPPESLGAHFNPFGKSHGAPTQEERHIGSLGNIEASDKGVASIELTDNLVKLIGPLSVIGRAFVVYDGEDDLGKEGSEMSLINGNAGVPIAYGIIGLSK